MGRGAFGGRRQRERFGEQIRIDATLLDIKSGGTVPLKIDVPSEKDIPGAVDRLAESIRQKLALPENVLKELKASSFQPSSKSIDALRDYSARQSTIPSAPDVSVPSMPIGA